MLGKMENYIDMDIGIDWWFKMVPSQSLLYLGYGHDKDIDKFKVVLINLSHALFT